MCARCESSRSTRPLLCMICISFSAVVYPAPSLPYKVSCTSRTVQEPRSHNICRILSSASVGQVTSAERRGLIATPYGNELFRISCRNGVTDTSQHPGGACPFAFSMAGRSLAGAVHVTYGLGIRLPLLFDLAIRPTLCHRDMRSHGRTAFAYQAVAVIVAEYAVDFFLRIHEGEFIRPRKIVFRCVTLQYLLHVAKSLLDPYLVGGLDQRIRSARLHLLVDFRRL